MGDRHLVSSVNNSNIYRVLNTLREVIDEQNGPKDAIYFLCDTHAFNYNAHWDNHSWQPALVVFVGTVITMLSRVPTAGSLAPP